MAKITREKLKHFIDASFGGEAEYILLGSDLEEYTINLNPSVNKKTNILLESTASVDSYEVSGSVGTFYADYDDPLYTKLWELANKRATGDAVKTTVVDVMIDVANLTVIEAYIDTVVVAIQSMGGDTTGVQIPFEVHYLGGSNRRKVNFDLETKTVSEITEEG